MLTGPQVHCRVDGHPYVQALFLFWLSGQAEWVGVGASPVSSGMPGGFDHFETPLGVFKHSTVNPDFRAVGTLDANGIRRYGAKSMRVFNFGWQRVPKGWVDGKVVEMRLQMHATDPGALEQHLGSPKSKGSPAASQAGDIPNPGARIDLSVTRLRGAIALVLLD